MTNTLALGMMMASDEKKSKADPAPKNETAPKGKGASDVTPSKAESGGTPATAALGETPATAALGETPATAAPSKYSRGEGQKPVSQAYRDNWSAIFANKKKKR